MVDFGAVVLRCCSSSYSKPELDAASDDDSESCTSIERITFFSRTGRRLVTRASKPSLCCAGSSLFVVTPSGLLDGSSFPSLRRRYW
jgi:hypothetical protein